MGELISFVVQGEPVAKGRPRFRQNGFAYTPAKTANYENLVKLEYHNQAGDFMFDDCAELAMRIEAFFGIPKSKSKRVQHEMEIGITKHTKRPDADNILKAVADALNGVAYKDDSALCYVEVVKKYSRTPQARITIWEL